MLESLFNIAPGLRASNFISSSSQKRLQHKWFLRKLWNFSKQLFYGTLPVAAFDSVGFCLLLNVHFNMVQINRWLYLSSSPWGSPVRCDLFWKRIDPKNFLFTGTNNWIALAFDGLYFFYPELADILEKAGRKTRRRTHMFHTKAIIFLCVIWPDRKYRWSCSTATAEPIQ